MFLLSKIPIVSFRALPAPSLSSIRKICEHYEAKCSGRYNSLASRYVLQMTKEIGTQIDAMNKMELDGPSQRKSSSDQIPGGEGCNSKFGLNNVTSESVSDETKRYFQDCSNDIVASERMDAKFSSKSVDDDIETSGYPHLEDIKRKLLQTKIELQEKARELEQREIENNQKLQLERQHLRKTTEILIEQHKDEITNLKRDIQKVKHDAKVVIDFVRRKANKALENEIEKRKIDKIRMSKQFDEKESILRERFNRGLSKVEREVKYALHNEKFIIQDADSLPSPPKSTLRSRGAPLSKEKMRIPKITRVYGADESDDSVQGDARTDDSLSSRESQPICFSENQKWFHQRINELDEWTDTLAATLQAGSEKMTTPSSHSLEPALDSPPPLKRVSTKNKWEI